MDVNTRIQIHPLLLLCPHYRFLGIHMLGGWVNPNAGLDNFKELKIVSSHDTNPNFSIVHSYPSRCTNWIMKSKKCYEVAYHAIVFIFQSPPLS
jgi:hypothetical protein